ncbi:MAG TPA: YdcF family protein [Hanamia sp.]|nr:YdcF family protein [Hanamia sp.]
MKKIKFFSLLLLISVGPIFTTAQTKAFDPTYQFFRSDDPVQDKDFYFLTLLEKLPKVRSLVNSDQLFQQRLLNLKSLLQAAPDKFVDNCTSCNVSPFLWTKEENDAIENEFISLLEKDNQALQILGKNMRASGYFVRYHLANDLDMVKKAWEDAARNMNYIMNAYTTNKGMLYPSIDSSTFAVNGEQYKMLVKTTLMMLRHHCDSMNLFFQPALQLSLSLLFVNYRNEAVRLEPLDLTNAKAYLQIPHTDWHKYPYSLILIPGEGPENDKSISPMGKYRCILGAEQFKKGMAPFIVVSGGFVHPFQTPYCEAFEMKQYLMDKLGIPESVIIMEPHARHTTTNIRNTNRILYRNFIPADKQILCTSTPGQISYILNKGFRDRCIEVMNFVPWRDMKQVDEFNLTFYPVEESLQMDASDPLDP